VALRANLLAPFAYAKRSIPAPLILAKTNPIEKIIEISMASLGQASKARWKVRGEAQASARDRIERPHGTQVMSSPPILFLDVDGVLNNAAIFASRKFGPAPICPQRCGRLLKLVDDLGCRIVLSSSWRGVPSLERKLRAAGIFERAHKDRRTPHLYDCDESRRGREIALWLARHPQVTRFAIVDDESEILSEQRPYFVRTNFKTGLLDKHIVRLAAILSR